MLHLWLIYNDHRQYSIVLVRIVEALICIYILFICFASPLQYLFFCSLSHPLRLLVKNFGYMVYSTLELDEKENFVENSNFLQVSGCLSSTVK